MYYSLKIRSLLSYTSRQNVQTQQGLVLPSRELNDFHKMAKLAEGHDPICLGGLEDRLARMLNFEERSGSSLVVQRK